MSQRYYKNMGVYHGEKYQALRPIVGNTLPIMSISTIKRDANGAPCRAKYRIVVPVNLDQHNWSTADCFAPVMSQMEMHLLLAISVQKRCLPKSGDFVQAFCQSLLPPPNNMFAVHPQAVRSLPTTHIFFLSAHFTASSAAPNTGSIKQPPLLNH